MGHVIWVPFHLGQDVSHSVPVLILSNVGELRSGEAKVQAVFRRGLLGQAQEAEVLPVQQVLWRRGRVPFFSLLDEAQSICVTCSKSYLS